MRRETQATQFIRVLTRARARGRDRGRAQNATNSTPPDWLSQTTGLATEIAWAEWLFGAPDASPDLMQTHLMTFRQLATAPDDWTRLLGLTSLMLLGEGTPQRCVERNALLDRGMLQPVWFDPAHPAARFFRATPREFFAQAAEVLDPEGKTELARWRQQNAT